MSLAAGSWFKPLREWLPALIGALQRERAIVRVVLAEVRGYDAETRLAKRYQKFRNMGRLGIEFVDEGS